MSSAWSVEQGEERRVAHIAAVPIGLAADLDRVEEMGRQAEAITASAVIFPEKTLILPVRTLVAEMKSFAALQARTFEIDKRSRRSRSGLMLSGLKR